MHISRPIQDRVAVKMGKVIGRVVCEKKIESFEGKTLLLVQPIDQDGKNLGTPIVAIDTVRAGEGESVMYEGGKEAAMSLEAWFNPCDAAVIGIIDSVDSESNQ